jgi:signal peptidase I
MVGCAPEGGQPQRQPPHGHPYTPRMRKRHLLIEILQTVALTVIAYYLLMTFVTQPFRVEQTSMQNSFQPGEYVMVDKITPRITGFHRGDVVIFRPPESWPSSSDGTPYIKRVIGLPGETIVLGPEGLTVDGTKVDEPYVYREGGSDVEELTSWTLGPDEILVFGDHRSNSSDSRAFGPIPSSSVIGRAFVRYFPLDQMSVVVPPEYPSVP